jgi:hypothetical protein
MTIKRKHDVSVSYNTVANGESFQVDRFANEKDSGVMIDSHLSFENHINETVRKANKIVGVIGQLSDNKIVGVIKHNFKDLNVKTL